jgi:hypothetical protein
VGVQYAAPAVNAHDKERRDPCRVGDQEQFAARGTQPIA